MTSIVRRVRNMAERVMGSVIGLNDADVAARSLIRRVEKFTMTSHERLFGLVQAIRYVSRARTPGAIVECGVWRGGSSMAAALALIEGGDTARDLYLFDTYEGMSAPTEADRNWRGSSAAGRFSRSQRGDEKSSWCYASIEDVRANLLSTGYEEQRLHFVKGKVEDTLPREAPDQIALLRLDTDWYESTRHEMTHLYPRLAPGGVLIIDDYGYWEGARKAVDEYLESQSIVLLLNRLDNTGRVAIKP
jgi:O-methyltransferase